MITRVSPEIAHILSNGSTAQRVYVCEDQFAYFAFYYFHDYFEYDAAYFHWDFFDDCNRLLSENINIMYDEAAWIAFRESAKTTIAKILVVWVICYRKRRYIAWDSYDGTNAGGALFDVATILQTNKRLIKDFGRLFRKRKHQKTADEIESDAPEKKSTGLFITTNGVRCEAFSTQKSARGRLTGKHRPDFFIFDDVENEITVLSMRITMKVKAHISAVRSGLGVGASVLYLGNLLTEDGTVSMIMDGLKNRQNKIVRNIPVVKNGVIAWSAKYVLTRREALEVNIMLPRHRWVVSLEKKKEDLNMDGKNTYEKEMLNDPGASGDYYFDRMKIRLALDKAMDPKKDVAGFKTWGIYEPGHRYGGGGDVAEGIGADSCAAAFFDFSQTPNLLIGAYTSNEIDPGQFGTQLSIMGRQFGEAFLVPELNGPGYATILRLMDAKYWNMYIREVENKTSGQLQKEFGWKALGGTVYEVASQFKAAFESGEILILSRELLTEMYHYTKENLRSSQTGQGMTAHFDLLRAAMLAWKARERATVGKEDKNKKVFKQDLYVPS